MDPSTFIDPRLTQPDLLVLQNLLDDIELARKWKSGAPPAQGREGRCAQQSLFFYFDTHTDFCIAQKRLRRAVLR